MNNGNMNIGSINKLAIEDYPFALHSLPLEDRKGNPITLSYIDENPDAQETLLCVHGNPTWSFYFRSIIKKFAKTHRVIALDHIGCGLSSKPQDYNYCLQQHIDNLTLLTEALKLDQVHLLVHDWGGAIGLGWATQRTPSFAGVKSLTLCNTAAFWSPDIPKRIAVCKVPFIGEWAMRALNLFALAAIKMASKKGLSKTAREGLLHPYQNYHDRIAIARFVQDIPILQSHPTFKVLESVEKKLKEFTGPVQMIWGKHDFCFNLGFLKKWQLIFPNAEVTVLDDAGHYLFEDEPEKVTSQMELFLGSS